MESKGKLIILNEREFTQLLFCSFRYYLGRQTIAVHGFIKDFLRAYWDDLDRGWQLKIQKEIRGAVERGEAGDPRIDQPEWEKLLRLPIKENIL